MPQVKNPPISQGRKLTIRRKYCHLCPFMSLLERFKLLCTQLGKVQHDEENLGIQRFYIQHKGQENDADPYCSIEINHIHATGLQVQAEKKRRHDFRDT